MFGWLQKLFSRQVESTDPDYVALKHEYPLIHDAANVFLLSFGPAFTGTPKGHIQTDIAGAAAISGSTLLRYSDVDLSGLPVGAVVLSEVVNERLNGLFRFVAVAAHQLNLPGRPATSDVPDQHDPLFDILELIEKLRAPLERSCLEQKVKPAFHPHVGILTAMKLVSAGHDMGLLNQAIGRSILVKYMVAGAKTVPR